MKIGDLKKKADAILKFEKLPRTIDHPQLILTSEGLDWAPCKRHWVLKLESAEDRFVTHPDNSGLYRIAYVLEGPEGEEQAIPFGMTELDEMLKLKGTFLYNGGFYGDDISKLINRLYDWLDLENRD